MYTDVLNIIYLYLDLDNFYKLKGEFNLSILYYCQNVVIYIDDAIVGGYLEVVKYLYDMGVTITRHAMNLAIVFGHEDIVYFLRKKHIEDTIFKRILQDNIDIQLC